MAPCHGLVAGPRMAAMQRPGIPRLMGREGQILAQDQAREGLESYWLSNPDTSDPGQLLVG